MHTNHFDQKVKDPFYGTPTRTLFHSILRDHVINVDISGF